MCSPCTHQCRQGRNCPTRLQQQQPDPFIQVRRDVGEALAKLRERYHRLRHAAAPH